MAKTKRILTPWCKAVKIELIKKDLSTLDLAKAIGTSREYVSSIVNGRAYSDNAVEKICDYLNLPFDIEEEDL